MKNLKILGLIPARGGSKGIPNKNIINICDKPLIFYTIMASLNSQSISATYVSTDSEEISLLSEKFGAKIIPRPKKFATDKAKSESVIEHALNFLKKKKELYDIVVLLQPTSPLRNSQDIDSAVETFLKKEAISLYSVFEPEHSPYKALVENDKGFLKGIAGNEFLSKRRQDLPVTYMQNGAIYIINSKYFIENKSLMSEKTVPFLMSREKSIDIDSYKDIEKVEKLLNEVNFQEVI